MTNLRQMAIMAGAIAAFSLLGPGCDGGTGSGSAGSAGSTSDGGGGDGGTAGSGGAGAGQQTGGGGSGATTQTGGGGAGGSGAGTPSDQGVQATDFVSAGGATKSANFKLVFTLGQSTQNQGRSKSSNYVMQGGLIGATGSLK